MFKPILNPGAFISVGTGQTRSGAAMDAIAEYLEAIKLAPHAAGLHEELGSEYSSAGKPVEGGSSIFAANWKRSHKCAARQARRTRIAQGDGARAKESIEAAIKEKPACDILTTIWDGEMLIGEDENALRQLSAGDKIEADPDVLQQAWFQLWIVYRHLHRMPEAQQAIATFNV